MSIGYRLYAYEGSLSTVWGQMSEVLAFWFDDVYSYRWIPMFRRNLLPPSSGCAWIGYDRGMLYSTGRLRGTSTGGEKQTQLGPGQLKRLARKDLTLTPHCVLPNHIRILQNPAHWRWGQHASPKRQCPPPRLHDVTTADKFLSAHQHKNL
jgi:hypothetical protein